MHFIVICLIVAACYWAADCLLAAVFAVFFDLEDDQALRWADRFLLLLLLGFVACHFTSCKPKPAPSTVPVNTVDTTRQRLERNAQRAKKTKDSLRSISKTAQPYASATADYDSVREHLR